MTTPTTCSIDERHVQLDLAIGELLAACLAHDLDSPTVVTAHAVVSRAVRELRAAIEQQARIVDGVDVAELRAEIERHRAVEAALEAVCTGHNCLPSFEWKQCSDGWKERCLKAEAQVRELRRQLREQAARYTGGTRRPDACPVHPNGYDGRPLSGCSCHQGHVDAFTKGFAKGFGGL